MYHCIVNPTAGRAEGRKLIPLIKKALKDVDIKVTEQTMDAARWAKEACAAGSRGIIGIGGDGTMQEIVTGMLNGRDKCDTPLGVISCGSGNDWRRSFQKGDNKASLQAIFEGNTRAIDAIRIDTVQASMACINIANIGLDARITRNAQPFKKFFGKNSYILSAIISTFRHKSTPITMYIEDEERVEEEFTFVAVCNGQYYGGGMRITPSAEMDDGRITLLLVKAMSGLQALTLFPVVLMGRHTGLRVVRYVECERVVFELEDEQTLCLDGNLYECGGRIEFKILPGAVNVFHLHTTSVL